MKKEKTLKKQVISSSFWVFGANTVSRVISLISTLILAKLLTPADFGVIGYGFLVVQTFALFRDMGFNSALIYQKDNIQKATSSAFWFSVVWSLFLYLVIFSVAPVAAGFFREPKLVLLLRCLSINIIFVSTGSVPQTLMEKEINFKRRMIPEVLNQIVYGIITVAFAFLGLKYWAFVIGTVTASFLQMIVSFALYPIKISLKVDFKILKEMFSFGKNIMSLGFLYFGIRNIDDFVVGRMLGTIPLGIYQFSYRIANIPATNISNVLGKILYPSFTKIAHDNNELRKAFLKSFSYVVLITIPITFYIILVIPDFINLFYKKWINAILPIQLIAYNGGVRAVSSGIGSVFYAKGKPEQLLPIAIIQFLLLISLLYPTVHFFGLTGVCWLINLSMTISFILSLKKLMHLIELDLRSIFHKLANPFFISMTVYFIMFFITSMYLKSEYLIFLIKIFAFPVTVFILGWLSNDTLRAMIKDFRFK